MEEKSWEYLGLEWEDVRSEWAQMKNAVDEHKKNKKVIARCLRNISGLWGEDQAVLFQELSGNELEEIATLAKIIPDYKQARCMVNHRIMIRLQDPNSAPRPQKCVAQTEDWKTCRKNPDPSPCPISRSALRKLNFHLDEHYIIRPGRGLKNDSGPSDFGPSEKNIGGKYGPPQRNDGRSERKSGNPTLKRQKSAHQCQCSQRIDRRFLVELDMTLWISIRHALTLLQISLMYEYRLCALHKENLRRHLALKKSEDLGHRMMELYNFQEDDCIEEFLIENIEWFQTPIWLAGRRGLDKDGSRIWWKHLDRIEDGEPAIEPLSDEDPLEQLDQGSDVEPNQDAEMAD